MVTGEAGAVLTGHAAAVRAVAVASGAGTLVSASEDKSVRLWGLGTWECFRVLQARFLPSSPYSCAPSLSKACCSSYCSLLSPMIHLIRVIH